MKHPSLRRWGLALAGAALVAAAALLFYTFSDFAPRIDGRALSRSEWDFYRQSFRAEVSAQYYQQSGLDLSSEKSLWNTPVDGVTPQQTLDRLALEAACRDEALRALALEYGVQPLPAFRQMQKDLDSLNAQRQAQKQAGEAIYGVVEYDLQTYYSTVKGQCETDVVGKLMEEAQADAQRMQSAYDQMSAEDFSLRPTAALQCYKIEAEEFLQAPDAAAAALQRLQEQLEQQGVLSEQQAAELAGFPVARLTLQLSAETISREDAHSMQLLEQAQQRGAGRAFCARATAQSSVDSVFYVETLEGAEKPSLESSAAAMASWYANRQFDERLEAKAKALMPAKG